MAEKDTDDDSERARDRRRESLLIGDVHSTRGAPPSISAMQRRRNEKGRADKIGAAFFNCADAARVQCAAVDRRDVNTAY